MSGPVTPYTSPLPTVSSLPAAHALAAATNSWNLDTPNPNLPPDLDLNQVTLGFGNNTTLTRQGARSKSQEAAKASRTNSVSSRIEASRAETNQARRDFLRKIRAEVAATKEQEADTGGIFSWLGRFLQRDTDTKTTETSTSTGTSTGTSTRTGTSTGTSTRTGTSTGTPTSTNTPSRSGSSSNTSSRSGSSSNTSSKSKSPSDSASRSQDPSPSTSPKPEAAKTQNFFQRWWKPIAAVAAVLGGGGAIAAGTAKLREERRKGRRAQRVRAGEGVIGI